MGKTWIFSTSSIKFYPCCRYSAGHLDACLQIYSKYHPNTKKIKKISIQSSDYTINVLTTPLERKLKPQTTVDGQFSMPYQAAAALVQGVINIKTFEEESFKEPKILELIPKIEWRINEEFERRYPASYSCAVTVTMDDGQEFTSVVDNPKGDYRNPMTQEEIENKFISLAQIEIADKDKIRNIIGFVNDLEKTNDINKLFSLID